MRALYSLCLLLGLIWHGCDDGIDTEVSKKDSLAMLTDTTLKSDTLRLLDCIGEKLTDSLVDMINSYDFVIEQKQKVKAPDRFIYVVSPASTCDSVRINAGFDTEIRYINRFNFLYTPDNAKMYLSDNLNDVWNVMPTRTKK